MQVSFGKQSRVLSPSRFRLNQGLAIAEWGQNSTRLWFSKISQKPYHHGILLKRRTYGTRNLPFAFRQGRQSKEVVSSFRY